MVNFPGRRYVGLEIGIHGLPGDQNAEEIRSRVEGALRREFQPDYDGDIEVELIESAGPVPAKTIELGAGVKIQKRRP
jgi:hypothetical protein